MYACMHGWIGIKWQYFSEIQNLDAVAFSERYGENFTWEKKIVIIAVILDLLIFFVLSD